MTRLSTDFIKWCADNHNSPDIMNLNWWLTNRANKPDADRSKILAEIKGEDPRFWISGLTPKYNEEPTGIEDLL